jgi:hypothetical protein
VSKFIRSTPFATTFDGDEVRCELKPLERGDFLKVTRFEDELSASSVTEMIDFLPTYVENFRGLRDAAGAPVAFEDAYRLAFFFGLMAEIAGTLLKAASLRNPKMPGGPSASLLPASESPLVGESA